MPSALAAHLAERFAADARGLRARAAARPAGARPAGARGTPGPSAGSYGRMAEACDRMRALFAEAADEIEDDEGLRALVPRLGSLVAGARSPEERNVYAGAVGRLTEALDGGADDEDEDDL